jgi:hypothetical protein
MSDRKLFVEKIAQLDLSRAEQAIALLWFYRQNQDFEERTATELAQDLADEHLGKPNVTQLHRDLSKSKQTVKGKRAKTFQIHAKYLSELNTKYEQYLGKKPLQETSSVIPTEMFQGTKSYFEKLILEINTAYDSTLYDCAAVILRRILESLIIEVFISKKIVHEIRPNNSFLMLDPLIGKLVNNQSIILGRNTHDAMLEIKRVGDTAAHDRSYITQKEDIDNLKINARRTFYELLTICELK